MQISSVKTKKEENNGPTIERIEAFRDQRVRPGVEFREKALAQ